MSTTTNLSITSFTKDDDTGDMDCTVTSASPLYINDLILSPYPGLTAPLGRVTPGTPSVPALRTIYLNDTSAIFSKVPPTGFTLAVTYDSTNNYVVLSVS